MDLQQGPQVLILAGFLCFAMVWALANRRYLAPVPDIAPEADLRARRLLHSLLSEVEQAQLAVAGYLAVPGLSVEGREYRVPHGPGWVEVYETGKLCMRLCVEPLDRLPAGDVMVMHKLMIEGNEREYLREANVIFIQQTERGRPRRSRF
ncbi:MAG TPA: hypothetical protein VFD42_01345 [Chloroflexota bacterium]|nr:hypothetical protein [Chloroflexota bacterium]